jgi:hypothetical protein
MLLSGWQTPLKTVCWVSELPSIRLNGAETAVECACAIRTGLELSVAKGLSKGFS